MTRRPQASLLLGEHVGHYRLESVLGEGGMAQVFAARHRDASIAKKIAIKVLLPEYSQDPGLTQRFINEARAVARIDHPGVTTIFDVLTLHDGRVCLLMEYLDGIVLSDWIVRRQSIDIADCVDIAKQIADILAAAHRCGIVHRDVKPDNIFLVRSPGSVGRVKVLDFGIAKLLEGAGGVVTATTSTFGTPQFMSPEQFRSAKYVDHRADIYSLGCVLYLLITGNPPFTARNLTGYMNAHVFQPPDLAIASNPAVPDWLDRLALMMLAKMPEHRPPSMEAVRASLEQAIAAQPVGWLRRVLRMSRRST